MGQLVLERLTVVTLGMALGLRSVVGVHCSVLALFVPDSLESIVLDGRG